MKLDKLKFARLIGIITDIAARTLSEDEIDVIDHVIDIDVTPVEVPGKANAADVDALMNAIHEGKKIEAIKAHRSLTGYGLKESKEAVEKYWVSKLIEPATLGDSLDAAAKVRINRRDDY